MAASTVSSSAGARLRTSQASASRAFTFGLRRRIPSSTRCSSSMTTTSWPSSRSSVAKASPTRPPPAIATRISEVLRTIRAHGAFRAWLVLNGGPGPPVTGPPIDTGRPMAPHAPRRLPSHASLLVPAGDGAVEHVLQELALVAGNTHDGDIALLGEHVGLG